MITVNRYIYKLYFKNGCTYVGKHTQKKENDGYITSSSYYKKHKDLLERRVILIENIKDDATLDIMETLCIFHDICESPYNVNRNRGAWLSSGKFDRGFSGPANGMYGKKCSEETRKKMSEAWTEERRKRQHAKHWYNNGIIEIEAFECPNGFTKGRLKFSKERIANMKAAMQRLVQNGGNRHNLGKKAWNSGKKIGPNIKLQKPVMNTETGAKYESIKQCCEQEGITKTQFYYRRKKNGKYVFIGK